MTAHNATPIACNLNALSREEGARRAELAAKMVRLATRIVERDDGYALRLDPNPATARDAFEWLALERRCCPFLRLQLSFEPEQGPLWISLGGSAEIKAFLTSAGLGARDANATD